VLFSDDGLAIGMERRGLPAMGVVRVLVHEMSAH
jgi:hypothetical protein